MSELSDLRYLPICEPCIRGEGDECHTPGCALWMRDVPPDGLVDLSTGDLVAERDAAQAKLEQAGQSIAYLTSSRVDRADIADVDEHPKGAVEAWLETLR